MKIITQFKNWLLNMIGHKNSPMITVFICIIIILVLISHGKSKQINTLKENFWINQVEHMDEAIESKCEEKIKLIDSLYLEISDIGLELDSMKLKYDE